MFIKTMVLLWDFNEILWSKEKMGNLRRESQMEQFRECVEQSGLIDLGFVGAWFTWQRSVTENINVKERLDRCFANRSWYDLFPNYKVAHLTASVSDHYPIIMYTDAPLRRNSGRGRRRFHSEAFWSKIRREIERLKHELEELQSCDTTNENMLRLKKTKGALNVALENNETFWLQRSCRG
ncbi:hypothetical protein PTKIN_Ptkin16aG0079700 [Pterospermum kingtungense]